MGYRLEISKIIHVDEFGSKLFGYVEDETKLKSYQWLLKKGFIKGDETWTYGCNPQIILTMEEYKEFITLYYEDSGFVLKEDEEMKTLMELKCDKLLEWY